MKKETAASAATEEKQAGSTPPVETPPADQTPATALEQPSAGGSYVRQGDGTLVKQEG